MTQKVLIIEDDPSIQNVLILNLQRYYDVVSSGNGEDGYNKLKQENPDLVILDLGLPDIDGMTLLEKIKEEFNTPIIILSARQRESDKVQALDAGASDYVSKPFGMEELLARIRKSMRHHSMVNSLYEIGDFQINFDKRRVYMKNKHIHLTPIEYKIVSYLSLNPGKVLTHKQIMTYVWGPFETDNQILRVNMANIRRKIEENPASPIYFITELGIGYRLADKSDLS